jgi:hypothetical protein
MSWRETSPEVDRALPAGSTQRHPSWEPWNLIAWFVIGRQKGAIVLHRRLSGTICGLPAVQGESLPQPSRPSFPALQRLPITHGSPTRRSQQVSGICATYRHANRLLVVADAGAWAFLQLGKA